MEHKTAARDALVARLRSLGVDPEETAALVNAALDEERESCAVVCEGSCLRVFASLSGAGTQHMTGILVGATVEAAQEIRGRLVGQPHRSAKRVMREAAEKTADLEARVALLEGRMAAMERGE